VANFDFRAGINNLLARRPRLSGLLTIALAGVLIGWNAYSMSMTGPLRGYYRSAYLVGYPGVLAGVWFLLTGRARPDETGIGPRWWVLGSLCVVLGGIGYGLYDLHTVHGWPW
jgi:hypothetical protein